jgi:CarD family transcriptional regulator
MFQLNVGDLTFYPAQGVACVESIVRREVFGQEISFFRLRLLETEDEILIPILNAAQSSIRPLIGASEAREVISEFDRPIGDYAGVSWIRRRRGYDNAVSKGCPFELAVVFRDLHVMRLRSPLSFEQLRLYERARRMVVFELACALGLKPTNVEHMLMRRIERVTAELQAVA